MNRILPTVSNPQPSTSAQNLEIDFGNSTLQTENEMMPETEDSSDADYQPNESYNDSDSGSDEKHYKRKLPPEIIQKIVLQCGSNASCRIISTFIGIGIEIAGGDPKNYSMSKSELYKQLSYAKRNIGKYAKRNIGKTLGLEFKIVDSFRYQMLSKNK